MTGARLIPWLVDRGLFPVRRHDGPVSREPFAPDDYHWARQVAALLLIATWVVIVVLDAIADDYEVSPPVLMPLLLIGQHPLSVAEHPVPVLGDVAVVARRPRRRHGPTPGRSRPRRGPTSGPGR